MSGAPPRSTGMPARRNPRFEKQGSPLRCGQSKTSDPVPDGEKHWMASIPVGLVAIVPVKRGSPSGISHVWPVALVKSRRLAPVAARRTTIVVSGCGRTTGVEKTLPTPATAGLR
jgi:hypothetical protein